MRNEDKINLIEKMKKELTILQEDLKYEKNVEEDTISERMFNILASTTDTVGTSLYMSSKVFDKLENLNNYIGLAHVKSSRDNSCSFRPYNLNEVNTKEFINLTKSFKTRFITACIEQGIEKWEKEYGKTPEMNKVRWFNKDENEYYRSFIWEENSVTHGLMVDKRSRCCDYVNSDDTNTDYVKEWYSKF